jgi:hypothetical protein
LAACCIGVVPGRGPSPNTSSRRMTFMVAFWSDILMRPNRDGEEIPGSARPLPVAGHTKHTWINQVPLQPRWSLPPSSSSSTATSATKDSDSNNELSLANQRVGQAHPVPQVWHAFTADDAALMRVKLPGYEQCHQGF